MKARISQTSRHCRRRERAMPEAIPRRNAMTPICGRMNLRFSISPAKVEIQSDLSYDFRTNIANCPRWRAWMGEKQPRLLVI
jgi:hypothetical protein